MGNSRQAILDLPDVSWVGGSLNKAVSLELSEVLCEDLLGYRVNKIQKLSKSLWPIEQIADNEELPLISANFSQDIEAALIRIIVSGVIVVF